MNVCLRVSCGICEDGGFGALMDQRFMGKFFVRESDRALDGSQADKIQKHEWGSPLRLGEIEILLYYCLQQEMKNNGRNRESFHYKRNVQFYLYLLRGKKPNIIYRGLESLGEKKCKCKGIIITKILHNN